MLMAVKSIETYSSSASLSEALATGNQTSEHSQNVLDNHHYNKIEVATAITFMVAIIQVIIIAPDASLDIYGAKTFVT